MNKQKERMWAQGLHWSPIQIQYQKQYLEQYYFQWTVYCHVCIERYPERLLQTTSEHTLELLGHYDRFLNYNHLTPKKNPQKQIKVIKIDNNKMKDSYQPIKDCLEYRELCKTHKNTQRFEDQTHPTHIHETLFHYLQCNCGLIVAKSFYISSAEKQEVRGWARCTMQAFIKIIGTHCVAI